MYILPIKESLNGFGLVYGVERHFQQYFSYKCISWSVLLVEETGVPAENHQPVASHWQTLSHNGNRHWLHR